MENDFNELIDKDTLEKKTRLKTATIRTKSGLIEGRRNQNRKDASDAWEK